MSVKIAYDMESDVLYVKLEGEQISSSYPPYADDYTVMNYNADGEVVGLQIMYASDLTVSDWDIFYGRQIPKTLFDAVKDWYHERS